MHGRCWVVQIAIETSDSNSIIKGFRDNRSASHECCVMQVGTPILTVYFKHYTSIGVLQFMGPYVSLIDNSTAIIIKATGMEWDMELKGPCMLS